MEVSTDDFEATSHSIRCGMYIQEDNAPSHASKFQEEIFSLYSVIRLLWPGNSPDLNAIEPTWNWMKRKRQRRGVQAKLR